MMMITMMMIIIIIIQELERVEIQLEQSEQSAEGNVPPVRLAAASTSTQCSAATSSLYNQVPRSRDEHIRLRLVALISSLQLAARCDVLMTSA